MRYLLLCLGLTAAPVAAQAAPAAPASDTGRTDVLVLDHLFESGLLEHVPVFLQKDAVYRAEFDHPGVQLEWYTQPGDQPPYSIEVGQNLDPENRVTYEVYPSKDETVELRVVGGQPGEATHLKLYRDIRATKHRVAMVHAPGWAIGLEFQAGLHTSYAGDTAFGTGGTTLEACLSFRAGPGIASGTSGCAFGVEFQNGVSQFRLTYFYIEPRFRLFGAEPVAGHPSTEGGLLIRGALGSYAQTTGAGIAPPDPKVLGFGAYIARDIESDEKGNGWAIQGSVTYSVAMGAGGDGVLGRRNATFTSVKVGVGRYF